MEKHSPIDRLFLHLASDQKDRFAAFLAAANTEDGLDLTATSATRHITTASGSARVRLVALYVAYRLIHQNPLLVAGVVALPILGVLL